ncbi:MAG: SusE domain-containing protein, partial [Gillisia sp.]|nr:SusE domain-containing protein [Gillisia sp.]
MKKLSILLMAFVAFVGLNSCSSDDGVVFIAQPDTEGINFTNSFNESYILTPAASGNIAERFVWNTVDFDVPTNITYQLQGSTSADFSSFDIIGATGENNLGVKVSQLKSLATDAGLDNDANTEAPNTGLVYFRVRAFAGTDGGNGLSEMSVVKSITVILPEGEAGVIELPKIFVVGSFLAASGYGADWTPANGVPLAASADGKTDYEGFVYINVDSAEFKFLPSNEGWDGDYGDTGENNGDYSKTIEQEDEVNAGTPDGKAGYFLVKV